MVAIAIPFFFGPYRVGQFTLVLAYAVAVLGLNLLVGYSGQISLGHGAFFALGAYASAILIDEVRLPAPATLPIAAAVCFAPGLLLGLPALRLRGLYLALVTLGVAIAVPQLIKRFDGADRAARRASTCPAPAPGWVPLADDQFLYFLTLVLAVADVPARGEPRARPRRAGAGRDPRERDRRQGDGRGPGPLQDAARSRSARCTPASAARSTCSRSASWPPSRSR